MIAGRTERKERKNQNLQISETNKIKSLGRKGIL